MRVLPKATLWLVIFGLCQLSGPLIAYAGEPATLTPPATESFLEIVEIRRELNTLSEGAKKVGDMLMAFLSTMNSATGEKNSKQVPQERLSAATVSMEACLDSDSLYQSFSAGFAANWSAEQSERLKAAYDTPGAQILLKISRDTSTPVGALAASTYFRNNFSKLSKLKEEQVRMIVAASRYVDARTRLTRHLMPAVLKIQHGTMSESQLQNKLLASQDDYVLEGLAMYAYGTIGLDDSEMATLITLLASPDHRDYISAKNQALEPVTRNLFQCLLKSLDSLML